MYDYYVNDSMYYIDDFQWRLDVPYWEITNEQMRLLRAADMLQDYRMSIRQCSKETGIARSTLHEFIHTDCRMICGELSALCIRQFRENRYRISEFMWSSPAWRNRSRYRRR